jgi:membrane protease YdiL (CAAX protease family)
MAKPATPVLDILIVAGVTGLAYVLEGFADARGWIAVGEDARGATGMVCGALAAVCVVLTRGGTLGDLGFKRPKRWGVVPLQVLGILVAFVAAQNLVPLFLSSFVALPEPDFSRHAAVSGNLGAAIVMALILPFTASIPEEIIFRGFLIGRFSNMLGRGSFGASMSVLLQALIFGAIHFEWGIGGMLMTLVMGLVWGSAYLLCDRNLWVVILAHSSGHLLFVTQLYLAESIII